MQRLNLKPLQNFLQRVLILSEEAKSILQLDCDEARFALKSWSQETIPQKEVDKSLCTCNLTELDNQLQVTDVIREILQKQELKEKLKTNLSKERSRSRQPDIREIYLPKSKSLSRLKRTSSPILKPQSKLTNKESNRHQIINKKTCDENTQKETKQRSSSISRQIEINPKSSGCSENKKLPKLPHKDSQIKLRTGSQTNFVLANKQHFLKNSNHSEKKTHLPPLKTTESTLSTEFMKMQIQSQQEIIVEERLHRDENCPLNDNNVNSKVIDRAIKSVDAIEGLDRYGVPSSLVKVLKIYHSYVNSKLSNSETKDKRNEEVSGKFLMEFNNMCNERQNQDLGLEKLLAIVKGFIEILGELHIKDSNGFHKKELKEKYSNLDSKYKSTVEDKKENKFSKISTAFRNQSHNKRGWMSNGIWNDLCMANFEGMFKTFCIRYSSRVQLVSLFGAMQQLQRAKYREVLVHYLLYKVIPDAKKLLDYNSKEFIGTYKMCFTIIQVLNPKAPVLVKTE